MYIWNFEVETTWSFHSKDECGDREEYTVAAETFEDGLKKVQKIALDKSRQFVNDEDGKTHFPKAVTLIEGVRGSWLDG
jgi:hypothetical protein